MSLEMFKEYTAPKSPEEAAATLSEVEVEVVSMERVADLVDCASWDLRIRDLKTFANVLRGFATMTVTA